MRKLGIVIAISAAAALGIVGFADPAEANHGTAVCAATIGAVAGNSQFQGQAPPILKEPVNGAVQSCADDHLAHTVCGVASGIEGTNPGLAPVAGAVRQVNDGAAAVTGHTCGAAAPAAAPAAAKPPAAAGGGGGGAAPEVQAASAAPDGSLPRTGGELFAGAGFAVMSLGALIRRFLP